jgi:hypothetical protein
VYCVDFVADKIVSGGRDRVVKMYAFVYYRPREFNDPDRAICFILDGKISLWFDETYVNESVYAVL